MIEPGRRYVQQTYVEDPESPTVEAVAYHEASGYRYDCVGLEDDHDIIVAIEAERSNHDALRAVPADYENIAAAVPEAAVWIVRSRPAAHDVLEALNDPPEGDPRVEKTYSENMPPQRITIDTPGLTAIHTIQYLRDSVMELEPPGE